MSTHTSEYATEDSTDRLPVKDDVMLIDEVAAALKIAVKQIRRLERRGGVSDSALAETGSASPLCARSRRTLRRRRASRSSHAAQTSRGVMETRLSLRSNVGDS